MRIHRRTDLTLEDLAEWLNPVVAGLMNYYRRYYRPVMDPLLQRANTYMRRWPGRIQAAADHQAVQAVVDRTAPASAWRVRTGRVVRSYA